MLKDVYRGEKLQKLRKATDDMHLELSLAITQDQGKGSIFANITQINELLQSRLRAKVNLTAKNQLVDVQTSTDIKNQMLKMAEDLITKQERKMEMQMEADKLLLSSVEEIQAAINERFVQAQE
jgi:hypothetical protein